jgi:phosphoglycolate phosphatase
VDPSQAVVIGDELRDLNAAKAARMAFGAVSWGLTRPEAMEAGGPEFLFRQMSEIPKALLGERGQP